MPEVSFMGLPDDGRAWRLDWIGDFFYDSRPTPTLRLQFSAARDGGGRDYKIVHVSIAELPVFLLGRHWRQGSRDRAAERLATADVDVKVDVDITRPRFVVHSAYDKVRGEYIIPSATYHVDSNLRDTRVLLIKRPADEVGDLIIPCAEVLRAYYGYTSRLAYLFITGHWKFSLMHRLFVEDQCLFEAGGRAFVTLGRWIPDLAGRTIARIALSRIAYDSAVGIIKDGIAASQGKRFKTVVALPPFAGPANWHIRGEQIGSTSWPRTLVKQLRGCTGPLPFAELELFRENPGRTEDGDTVRAINPAFGIVHVPDQRQRNIEVYEDADPMFNAFDRAVSDEAIEPIEREVPISIHRNPGSGQAIAHPLVFTTSLSASYSAGVGEQASQHMPVAFEPEPTQDLQPGSLAFFEATLDCMPGVAIELNMSASESHKTILLASEDLDVLPWCSIGRGENRRRREAVVAHVRIDADVYTLCEIERRPSDQIPTLAITGVAGDTALFQIVCVFVTDRTSFVEAGYTSLLLGQYKGTKIKHNAATPSEYAKAILRRLGTRSVAAPESVRQISKILVRSEEHRAS